MNEETKWGKCSGCGFRGEHEVIFEVVNNYIDNIVFICPKCETGTVHGQRINHEEFYY